ncbi:MAG: rRNA maturation RNase YbeY [Candidatus Izemoplasmatales bacterium]
MIEINFINQYDDDSSYKVVINDIIEIAYNHLKINKNYIINVILVDNDYIKELNSRFRAINHPTDVLSFENNDMEEELGDVFISVDKVKSQAKSYEHSFNRELAFLTLHGFLHCLGYDHHTKSDEEAMFALQKEIIEKTKYKR